MEDINKTVSVVVDRKVLPGKVAEFKDYLKSIIKACSGYPGYLGTDVINPQGDNRYILVFRFASQEQLDVWSASEERNYWVAKIDGLVENPTEIKTLTGLETWFYLEKPAGFVPPPKYKMAIVTYLAIAPTFMLFNLVFGEYFTVIPMQFRIFAIAPFIVLLMTYMVMPMMTKLFKKFLFPAHSVNNK